MSFTGEFYTVTTYTIAVMGQTPSDRIEYFVILARRTLVLDHMGQQLDMGPWAK